MQAVNSSPPQSLQSLCKSQRLWRHELAGYSLSRAAVSAVMSAGKRESPVCSDTDMVKLSSGKDSPSPPLSIFPCSLQLHPSHGLRCLLPPPVTSNDGKQSPRPTAICCPHKKRSVRHVKRASLYSPHSWQDLTFASFKSGKKHILLNCQ